jgi:hypothetical protein
MKHTYEHVVLVVVAVLLAEASGFATANPAVPEITPDSVSAGLALLGAGVLMLRARRGSK